VSAARGEGVRGLIASIESLAASRAVLLICLLSLLAYANSLGGEFVFDDTDQIVTNQNLRSWTNLSRAFTSHVWAFRDQQHSIESPPPLPYYRPIFTVMLTVEYRFFGLWPQGWHLVSLLLHTLSSVGVFYVILLLSRRKIVALFAACLFAVHPIHAESVSWISGMTDPLFSVFFLASFSFYLKYRRDSSAPAKFSKPGSERRVGRFLAMSVLLFILAAFSKETALSLVLLVFSYEVVENTGATISRMSLAAQRALPFAAASLIYLIPRYAVLGELMWTNPQAPDRPWTHTLLTLPFVLASYLFHLAWPVGLSVTYDTRFITSAASPLFLLPAAALTVILAALFGYRKRMGREVWLALLLIFVPLLPVLKLGQVSREEFLVFDHYLYLSAAGWSYLIAIGVTKLGSLDLKSAAGSRKTRAALAAMVFILLGSIAVTASENRAWSDSYSVWSNAARVRPSSWAAQYNTGLALLDQNRFLDASDALGRAAAIKPDEAAIFDALGRASDGAGNTREAEDNYKRALEVDPLLFESLNNLGTLYFRLGKYAAAEASLVAAIKVRPAAARTRFNLGICRARLGRYDEAAREFEQATELEPDAEAFYELALAYEKLGRNRDAENALTRGGSLTATQELAGRISNEMSRLRGERNR